jgi:hypothetical protein
MKDLNSRMVQARSEVFRRLERDLIGPGWNEGSEELDVNEKLSLGGSNPLWKYLFGYLEPSDQISIQPEIIPELNRSPTDSSFTDSEEVEDRKATINEDELLLSPSSLGLTFKCSSADLQIKIDYGTYSMEESGIWARTHHKFDFSHCLKSGIYDFDENIGENIRLQFRVSREDSKYRVTVRLVNDRSAQNVHSGKALSSIFQPNLMISSDDQIFHEVRKDLVSDPQMYVLYRKSEILALGHNVGVNWSDDKRSVWIEHIPSYHVPKMLPDSSLIEHIPTMRELSTIDLLDTAMDKLDQFVSSYESWIDKCEENLKLDFQNEKNQLIIDEISEQINNGRNAVERMKSGILRIREDDNVRIAFTHANRAIQYSQEEPEVTSLNSGEFKWHPFQIAFQLVNLNGLLALDKNDEYYGERENIDLAWFPTGGGKTEAYFGLISLIGFFRRIMIPGQEKNPSVHAIMRYTLRLLTMDQGERLVRLMGGMNQIAKSSSDERIRSGQRFRVGMWIGKKASPNRIKGTRDQNDALSILVAQKQGSVPKSRVIMFEACPWCGDQSIRDPNNWNVGTLNGRETLIGKCVQSECIFSEESGIPFTCVDEDIYNNPPSVLLGTVDKFVQAAYNRRYKDAADDIGPLDVRRLLGYSDSDKVRPPDLIIQDELHLLTGPLGSMAGLLETALDVAWEVLLGHKPKYIAATATIRGAKRDAKLMFGRDLKIFPPPINNASNNFFASESENPSEEGRLHLSILGPPKKSRTLGDLPIASLLQSGQAIKEKYGDEVSDPYWTLVAYFNSLRELGGLQSSISSRISKEWIPEYSGAESNRSIENVRELTSRVNQTRLVESKKALEISLGKGASVDIVATSNMFQVGIDISRLGLMTINGQPKSNSEYIQSSGRVGRTRPGMVINLLRSTYPRDQSHYESHRSFHQEIYRHVDHTSTTPFSLRSLDRSLDTTLMAIVRLVSPELANNQSLNLIVNGDRRRIRKPVEDAIELFKSKIEGRLIDTQFNGINDQLYVERVIEKIDTNWMTLKRWVQSNQESNTCCWVEPSKNSRIQNPIWWARSGEDLDGEVPVISTLRDVADEVKIGLMINNLNGKKPDWANYSLPAGHMMSHASPGNLWEKDGLSYLTGGLSQWENRVGMGNSPLSKVVTDGGCLIKERVIDSQFMLLGPVVRQLRTSPTKKEHGFATATVFPRSFTCSLGHISRGTKHGEMWRCSRENCNEKAEQNRFVSVCSDGHLHPFDYSWWVHQGKNSSCSNNASIRLEKLSGHAYDLGRWRLTCEVCNSSRSMKDVPFASSEDLYGSKCGKFGEPWLKNNWEDRSCGNFLEHRQIGSASVAYNQRSSIMLIPLSISWDLANNEAVSDFIGEQMSQDEMIEWYGVKKERGRHRKIDQMLKNTMFDKEDGLDTDLFFQYLHEYDNLNTNDPLSNETIRSKERIGLRIGSHNLDSRFSCTKIELNKFGEDTSINARWPLSSLSRVDRLTELSFTTGLSRINDSNHEIPIDQSEDEDNNFGLGSYNYGEGIYFEINTDWLNDFSVMRKQSLGELSEMPYSFEPGRAPKNIVKQIPLLDKPVNRNGFSILHSLSHLLMKQLCQMSGYSLGSIRERLYYEANQGIVESAGILIYTSGPSSDGTLGGLAGQANQKRINSLVSNALRSKDMCSNDPVCSEHRSLLSEPNGSACHTCLILPETSCELRNHLLDRNWGD